MLTKGIDKVQLETAGTRLEGIRLAQEWEAEVTLLDPGLPGATEEQVLSAIDDGDFPPPVIVITSSTDPGLFVRSIEAGAMNFFQKDHLSGNLIQSIHNNYLRYVLHTCKKKSAHDTGSQ
jgi:FixJ family two-component response regulator